MCKLSFSNFAKKLTSQQLLKLRSRSGTPAALSLIQLRYFCKQKQTLNFAERNFLKITWIKYLSKKIYFARKYVVHHCNTSWCWARCRPILFASLYRRKKNHAGLWYVNLNLNFHHVCKFCIIYISKHLCTYFFLELANLSRVRIKLNQSILFIFDI